VQRSLHPARIGTCTGGIENDGPEVNDKRGNRSEHGFYPADGKFETRNGRLPMQGPRAGRRQK
jgi:hypothetical protein